MWLHIHAGIKKLSHVSAQKWKDRQDDIPGIHWRRWRQASSSPVNTKVVDLTTFQFLCDNISVNKCQCVYLPIAIPLTFLSHNYHLAVIQTITKWSWDFCTKWMRSNTKETIYIYIYICSKTLFIWFRLRVGHHWWNRLPVCALVSRNVPITRVARHFLLILNHLGQHECWHNPIATTVIHTSCVCYGQLLLKLSSAYYCGNHYSDVIMNAMASQITGVCIVCLTVGSGAVQRTSKLTGDFPQKAGTRKMFPFDDVIMTRSYFELSKTPRIWPSLTSHWAVL